MATQIQYLLPTGLACFYSIKLGGAQETEIRQECMENNWIAINFGMTEARHQRLLELRENELNFEQFLKGEIESKTAYTRNQHRMFYQSKPNSVWVTVYNGLLYFSEDVDQLNDEAFAPLMPNGWIRRRIKGWRAVPISVAKLPGGIRNLSIQRQTIVEIPEERKSGLFTLIKNVVNQDRPSVSEYEAAFKDRDVMMQGLIRNLGPDDFETLIDMILYRMSYIRESILGEQEKDFDGVYKDLRNDTDSLYVQVKCAATSKELTEFALVCQDLSDHDPGTKAVFAYHTGNLPAMTKTFPGLQVWDLRTVASHVIRLGLENWILNRVYA
jgi:hypothetical protein